MPRLVKITTLLARNFELPRGQDEDWLRDVVVRGFAVRLRRGAKGVTRTYVYQFNIGRADKRMTIGDATVLTAEEARRMAQKLQAEVRMGGDPSARKAQARAAAAETMGATLPTYLSIKRANLRPRSFVEVERHLMKDYRPLHGQALRSLTTAMLSARYERIAAEQGDTAANNGWRSLHAFLVWAMRQGLLDRNPAIGVERRKDKTRDRVLDAREIGLLWAATDDGSDYGAILRLLLLTGCRAGEISGLSWSEVLSDRIVLPAERVKNSCEHVVPITPPMQAILDSRPRRPDRDLVFGRFDGRPFRGWHFAKKALDARIAQTAGAPLRPWVVHDLRRTASTGMGELGIAPHVIEAALNHRSGFKRGIAGRYNYAKLETPVCNALTAWAEYVVAVAEGRVPAGDRVVSLARAS